MDLKLAELLCSILEDEGEDVSIDEEYSGRGMYGDTTAAITGDFSPSILLMLVLERVKDGWLTEDVLEDVKLKSLRQDSMGLGVVIY